MMSGVGLLCTPLAYGMALSVMIALILELLLSTSVLAVTMAQPQVHQFGHVCLMEAGMEQSLSVNVVSCYTVHIIPYHDLYVYSYHM